MNPDDFRNAFPELRNRNAEDIEFIQFGFIESLTTIARENFDSGYSGPAIVVVAWFGVAMAIGYELSGSVWPPVICHAAYNVFELGAPLVW